MTARNLGEVLDQLLDVVPGTNTPLDEAVRRIKSEACFMAPEGHHVLWRRLEETLVEHIGKPSIKWEIEVSRIVLGEFAPGKDSIAEDINDVNGQPPEGVEADEADCLKCGTLTSFYAPGASVVGVYGGPVVFCAVCVEATSMGWRIMTAAAAGTKNGEGS